MTQDKSLRSKASLVRQRSVLTRAERLAKLRDDGRWQEGQSIFGLPKVRVAVVKRRAKPKKEEVAVAAEGAVPAEAAAAGAAEAKLAAGKAGAGAKSPAAGVRAPAAGAKASAAGAKGPAGAAAAKPEARKPGAPKK